MRFRSLIAWLIILVILGWAAYTIIGAGSSYIEVSGMVDRAYNEAVQRRKAQAQVLGPGAAREFAASVRSDIVTAARHAGLTLDQEELVVSETTNSLNVWVRWSYPVWTYSGSTVLSLPLSVSRSYELPS